MKDKILTFIIGLLVGAIITASGFLVYQRLNTNTNQMPSGEKMQMMEKPDGETPPEKPSGTENNENESSNTSTNKDSSKSKSSKNKTTKNNSSKENSTTNN